MAMDSGECNESGEPGKVELGRKDGVEVGSEKDLTKSDGIDVPEKEENDGDGIGGPFVIVNGDSDDPSERDLDLEEKSDLATISEDKDTSQVNAADGIGLKGVMEEVELDNACNPAEEKPSDENSGAKLEEKVEQEGTDNKELCDNGADRVELGEVEHKESTEEAVVEETPVDNSDKNNGGEEELVQSEKLELEEKEVVVDSEDKVEKSDVVAESGSSIEEIPKIESIEEESGVQLNELVSESIETSEKEEKPEIPCIEDSLENGDKEEEVTTPSLSEEKKESEILVTETEQTKESDSSLNVEEETLEEVEQEASIPSSKEVMHEKPAEVSKSKEVELKASIPPPDEVTPEEPEAVSDSKEVELEASILPPKEVIHEEPAVESDSKEVELEATIPPPKEPIHEEPAVECDSKEVELEASVPPPKEVMHEEPAVVSDSQEVELDASLPPQKEVMNEESAAVSESKEIEQEASIPSPEEVMHEEPAVVSESKEVEREVIHEEPEAVSDSKEAQPDASIPPQKEVMDEEPAAVSDSKEVEPEVSIPPQQEVMNEEPAAVSGSKEVELEASIPPQKEVMDEEPEEVVQEAPETELKEEAAVEPEPEPTKDTEVHEEEPVKEDPVTEELETSVLDSVIETEIKEGNYQENGNVELEESGQRESLPVEASKEIENQEPETKCTERDFDLSAAKPEVAPPPHMDESVQIGNFTITIGENSAATLPVELQEQEQASDAASASTSNVEGVKTEPRILRKVFMVKVPRYSDEEQWAKIQDAQVRLDELTRKRDAISQLMHKKRNMNKDAWEEVGKAKEEERAARTAYNAKRHEINNVQSVINKLNKANSIDDMDDLIESKEKNMQHQTMSLKEEKLLIQEIKELKSKKKQLIENMGSAAEIDEAFDQKDNINEKLKTLKAEQEVLGSALSKAELHTKTIQKKYDDTERELCDVQDDLQAAHELREKAYFHWRHLRNELSKKNKHFFNYRDNQKEAVGRFLSINPDFEGLISYCNKQIEKTMDLWNNDDEFRKQYVESNKISTIRRLKTLDGRSLAPDEVPPALPSPSSSSFRRMATPATPTTQEINLENTSQISSSPPDIKLIDQFPSLPPIKVYDNGNNKSKKATSSKADPVVVVVVKERENLEVTAIEKAKMERKQKEEELERKKREEEAERVRRQDEIRRKANAEAAEKERLREEQKVKAKEAEERKKRKAEKAQERAEFKARKEAEIRDKKKAKKKRGEMDSDDASNEPASDSGMETVQVKERSPPVAPTVTKRTARPQIATKTLKRVEPIPAALRNKNRKKMRTWIIGISTAVAAVLTVFLIGNYLDFSEISSLFYV